jgi:hypothetical protein
MPRGPKPLFYLTGAHRRKSKSLSGRTPSCQSTVRFNDGARPSQRSKRRAPLTGPPCFSHLGCAGGAHKPAEGRQRIMGRHGLLHTDAGFPPQTISPGTIQSVVRHQPSFYFFFLGARPSSTGSRLGIGGFGRWRSPSRRSVPVVAKSGGRGATPESTCWNR